MQPMTYEDWLDISKERQADARALLTDRNCSIGPVYMAGYAVETSLKALLSVKGKAFPRSGNGGHNLKGLWKSTGLKFSDIKCENQLFFLQHWNTSFRYELDPEELAGNSCEALVKAAGLLTGWIKSQIKNQIIKNRGISNEKKRYHNSSQK